MKYKIYSVIIIVLIYLSFFSLEKQNEFTFIENNLPFVICIDPGHGGKDGGASVYNYFEKDINLEISLLLKNELNDLGYLVEMTRDKDYHLPIDKEYSKIGDLNERIKFIKSSKSIILLSIHANKFSSSSVSGCQVFYSSVCKSSLVLAGIIQKNVNCELDNDRFAKTINNNYLLRNLDIPSVIIECGFMSNERDLNNLINKDYQAKLAKIFAKSVNEYLLNYSA